MPGDLANGAWHLPNTENAGDSHLMGLVAGAGFAQPRGFWDKNRRA